MSYAQSYSQPSSTSSTLTSTTDTYKATTDTYKPITTSEAQPLHLPSSSLQSSSFSEPVQPPPLQHQKAFVVKDDEKRLLDEKQFVAAEQPAVKPLVTEEPKPMFPLSTPQQTEISTATLSKPKVDEGYGLKDYSQPEPPKHHTKPVEKPVEKPVQHHSVQHSVQKPVVQQPVAVAVPAVPAEVVIDFKQRAVPLAAPAPVATGVGLSSSHHPYSADYGKEYKGKEQVLHQVNRTGETVLHQMDKTSGVLREAEQVAQGLHRTAGAKTMHDAHEVLEATKALAVEKPGLAEKTKEFAVESFLAGQEAVAAAKSDTEVKGTSAAAYGLLPTAHEAHKIRTAADRLLSLLKMLVTSGEGRGIMMDLSALLKRVFYVMGDGVTQAIDTVTEGAVAAAEDQHLQAKKHVTHKNLGAVGPTATTTTYSEFTAPAPTSMTGGTVAPASTGATTGTFGVAGAGASTAPTSMGGFGMAAGAYDASLPTTAGSAGIGAGALYDKEFAQSMAQWKVSGGTGTTATTVQTQEWKGEHFGKSKQDVATNLRDQLRHTKNNLYDTKQLEITLQHVTALVKRIVREPPVREAVLDMIDIAREYQHRVKQEGKQLVSEAKSGSHSKAAQSHAERAAELAEEIIRELAPGELIDRITKQAREILDLVTYNPTISHFWTNLWNWFTEILNNPELLDKPESGEQLNEFILEGKETWSEVNREMGPKMRKMSSLLEQLANTLKNDQHLKAFQTSVNRLASDLFTTQAGRPRLKMEAINDIRSIIGPMITNTLRNLPVPPFSHSDDVYDFSISELVLRADKLAPDAIRMYAETMFDVNMNDLSANHELGRFTIFLRGVQVEAKNFRFYFKRKSFPKIKDEGHCDCWTSGRGVDLDISFREQATHPYLSAPRARCSIDKLNIKLARDTHHRSLINFLTSMFRGAIEKAIERGVQQAIEQNGLTLAEKINAQLLAWSTGGSTRLCPGPANPNTIAAFGSAALGAPPIPAVPDALEYPGSTAQHPGQPPLASGQHGAPGAYHSHSHAHSTAPASSYTHTHHTPAVNTAPAYGTTHGTTTHYPAPARTATVAPATATAVPGAPVNITIYPNTGKTTSQSPYTR